MTFLCVVANFKKVKQVREKILGAFEYFFPHAFS